jgi:hypothetical protein
MSFWRRSQARVGETIVEARLAQLQRTTAVPAVVRLVAAMSAALAVLVAMPAEVTASARVVEVLALAAVLAGGVGLFPRSWWVTAVALFVVLAWVGATVAFGDAVDLARVGVLAGLLYAMHASAAFAAVLPHDCVVAPGVLLRWARRQGAVLAAGLGVGLAGFAAVRLIGGTPTLAGPVLGAAVAAALAGAFAYFLRRP